jgi:beta-lactamase class A
MTTRRAFIATTSLTLASPGALARTAAAVAAHASLKREVAGRLRAIEREGGGDLGVCVLDTATGATFTHRADERFLMCSTFKLLAAAFVLHRADLGQAPLAQRIVFEAADLVPYSPVTEQRAGGDSMSLAALCEATLTTSDNTAANLMLASFGGPPALTAFVRRLGDKTTRFDRFEPTLNTWHGARDTTSPRAMLASVQRVTLGDALLPASRETLQRWLRANQTGGKRLKAGLPADWAIGDKTGSSDDHGISNDIAVVWPPGRAPMLVTGYLVRSRAAAEARDAALAKVGALLPFIASELPLR